MSGIDPTPDEIYSIGAGLRWDINKNINVLIYYGHGLEEVGDPAEYDLQDDGIHFGITAKR